MKNDIKEALNHRLSSVNLSEEKTTQILRAMRNTQQPKPTKKWKIALPAAAALVIIPLAFIILSAIGNGEAEPVMVSTPSVSSPSPSSDDPPTEPTDSFPINERKIIRSYAVDLSAMHAGLTGDSSEMLGMHIPYRQGEVMYSDALRAAMRDEANEDAWFSVWVLIQAKDYEVLNPYYNYDAYQYGGRTMSEIQEAHSELLGQIHAWKTAKFAELFGASEGALNYDKWSGSDEAAEMEAVWDAEFKASWSQNHAGEVYPIDLYGLAMDKWNQDVYEVEKGYREKMLAALEARGYAFSEVTEHGVYAAVLGREQLEQLPLFDEVEAFSVLFEDEKNCSFEGNVLGVTIDYRVLLRDFYFPEMDDDDVMEIALYPVLYSGEQLALEFAVAYPVEHGIIEGGFDPDTYNPEAEKDAYIVRDAFFAEKQREIMMRVLDKYGVAQEDVIEAGEDGGWCRIRAAKADIARMIEDASIRDFSIPGVFGDEMNSEY